MPEFFVPCLFGLEGPVAEELRRMDVPEVRAENGHVRFSGGASELARVNLRLRTGERVLVSLGRFPARSFDALFEGVKALPLGDYIPKNGAFPVKGYCLNSQLHSVPDCQRIIKKAAAEALGRKYRCTWLPEDGALYQLQFAIVNDEAELFLDTSGAPLFKRGYRPGHVAAPLRETLAAAMVGLARYRGRGVLCDPFCGSGTIAIEAALIARNRAPGLHRSFSAQTWEAIDRRVWREEAEAARALEYNGEYQIFASDIDPKAVALGRENAKRAGVYGDIRFAVADARELTPPTEHGIVVTNPPYGERMLERQQAEALYAAFGARRDPNADCSFNIICSHPEFERCFGHRADKKRKLYNGMIQCNLYMFFGKRKTEKS